MTEALQALKQMLDKSDSNIMCLDKNGIAHKYNLSEFEALIRTYASDDNKFFETTVAANSITKSGAVILVLSNVKELYARAITKAALSLFMSNKIPCYFSKIINSDDKYEALTENTSDVASAYELIKQRYIEAHKDNSIQAKQ